MVMTMPRTGRHPDAAAFLDAIAVAGDARQEKMRQLNAGGTRFGDDYWHRRYKIDDVYTAAVTTAWNLLADSKHPLMSWMGTYAREYPVQASVILEVITDTTTMDDLDKVARRHSWCSEWNRMRDRAIRAGVALPRWQVEVMINRGEWETFKGYRTSSGGLISVARVRVLLQDTGVTELKMRVDDRLMAFRVVMS